MALRPQSERRGQPADASSMENVPVSDAQGIKDVGSWNRLLTPLSSSLAILKRGRTALQHVAELPGRILGRLLGTLEAEVEVSQGMIWRKAEPPFSRVMLI